MLPGADGPRQIDVVVRSAVGPVDVLTIVECKDYARKVTVPVVDAFHSVLRDVGAHKGVIVTRRGYSGTAIKKAQRLGITLLVANQLSKLGTAVAEVPIYIRELKPTRVTVEVSALSMEEGTTLDQSALFQVNDEDLLDLVAARLAMVDLPGTAVTGRQRWVPEALRKPYFIRDVDGGVHQFDDLVVLYDVEVRHYYGHLSDVDSVIHLHDVSQQATHLLLSTDVLRQPGLHYRDFSEDEPAPFVPEIALSVVSEVRPSDVVPGGMSLRRLSD